MFIRNQYIIEATAFASAHDMAGNGKAFRSAQGQQKLDNLLAAIEQLEKGVVVLMDVCVQLYACIHIILCL